MALAGALIAVPAVIGPPAAGLLRDAWSANAVFLADFALIVVTLVIFVATTREIARPSDSRTGGAGVDPRPAVRHSHFLWSAYAAQFAITVGVGVLVAHLPLVLLNQGETAARAGYSFAIYALVSMLVMASPIGGASDRIGRSVPLIVGLVGVAAGLAVVGTAAGYGGIAIGMAVFGLGYGLVFPAATALVAEATGAGRRGMAFGVFYAVYSLGVAVGAAGSGQLAGTFENCDGPAVLRGSRRRPGCGSRCGNGQADGKNEVVIPHPNTLALVVEYLATLSKSKPMLNNACFIDS